jgi:putative transposase
MRRLSNLLDASFCSEALEEALSQGALEIFNTDQGSQFTDDDFTGVLRAHGVAISMDGRGRFADNIFVERLWRSLKYEEVYLKTYENVAEARQGIAVYFEFYNHQRLHQRSVTAPRARCSSKPCSDPEGAVVPAPALSLRPPAARPWCWPSYRSAKALRQRPHSG